MKDTLPLNVLNTGNLSLSGCENFALAKIITFEQVNTYIR